MERTESGWKLTQDRWLFSNRHHEFADEHVGFAMTRGLLINMLAMSGDDPNKLLFSRRYSDHLEALASLMNFEIVSEESEAIPSVEFG